MPSVSVKAKLDNGEFFCAPGAQDMITALIAKSLGFEVVYASGYWMGASAYGLPDVGITTYTQMLDRIGTMAKTLGTSAALIADADTGYGGLINVRETVRGYEAAGVQVIQIEDQEFPKKCGHSKNKRVVPTEDMVAKIKVALEARENPSTLIAARTDARQGEGFEGVLDRLRAYADAGADILFPEALASEYEMREVCSSIDRPMMINMADGGLTPIMNRDTLESLGYAFAIFPGTATLAATQAIFKALTSLRDTGTSVNEDVPLYEFSEFCKLIGFEDVWAFEERWKETEPES